MSDWSAAASSAAAEGSESEDDPEIVPVSPTSASSPTALAAASTTQSSLPSVHTSSASSSPPLSPSGGPSPLSSPTSAAAPPTSRRGASGGSNGSGNGYISTQQKRANMDLTGLGSNPRTPPAAASDTPSSRALPQSSSGSFLSSFAKKLTLNPNATNSANNTTSSANAASSPTAAKAANPVAASASKPTPAAAAAATATAGAAAQSTGRLSGSSSASLSISPSPPPASATATSAATPASGPSSAAVSSTAAPLSPTSSSSLPSSGSFPSSSAGPSSSGGGGGKFSLTSSFGSMLRSLSDITARDGASGSAGGGSSGSGGALSQTEQQKEQQKREWLSLLPPLSANGVAVTPAASQSFSNPKVKARCVKLAWFGIPSSVRGDAWQWIIGNSLNITEDLFWIMSGRAQEVKETKMKRMEREEQEREAMVAQQQQQRADGSSTSNSNGASSVSTDSQQQGRKANLSREESVSLIDTDVSRTFPELKFFHGGGPLQAPLYQVLESYGCYRPDVGYVQGMSHIASMLLLNMEPLPAFIAMCNLLNVDMYFKFFRMNAQQMKLHLDVFQQVFKDQLPQLYNHFASLGIEPDMYLYDWLLTIFTRALPLDVTHRVWDNFLCVGHVFLFRTALGLLRLQQPTFLQSSFEQSLALLNRPPRDIDGEALFDCIGRIAVTAERLNKMLQEAEGG